MATTKLIAHLVDDCPGCGRTAMLTSGESAGVIFTEPVCDECRIKAEADAFELAMNGGDDRDRYDRWAI